MGHCWVASLAYYNFYLEYQRGKDNTVADFLSQVEDCLPEVEVKEYMVKVNLVHQHFKLNCDIFQTL